MAGPDTGLALSQLFVYPVKSCGGVALEAAALTPTGLAFDRSWMVVRAGSGRFLSQRATPAMALVAATLEPATLFAGADAAAHPDAALALRAPGAAELRVPLAPPPGGRALVLASVWGWKGLAADEGDAAAAWLSAFLGVDVRLVRYVGGEPGAPPRARREVDSEFAPRGGASGDVAFADVNHLLLATTASLAALNKDIARAPPITADRFRPNLVVAGGAAWAEDAWARVRLGGGAAELDYGIPRTRCSIPDVDPATGRREDEATGAALRAARSAAALGWAAAFPAGAVFFGANFRLRAGAGAVLRVGDGVEVLERRVGEPRKVEA
jgi:uncharacterized protein YcbX